MTINNLWVLAPACVLCYMIVNIIKYYFRKKQI